jgi:hypothetical protein
VPLPPFLGRQSADDGLGMVPPSRIHFIVEGRVGIIVRLDDGRNDP